MEGGEGWQQQDGGHGVPNTREEAGVAPSGGRGSVNNNRRSVLFILYKS